MIKIYNGDCLIESDKIEDGSVDLILTDLPYGTTACSWDEIIPIENMWDTFYRVLRPNGFIVLTASQPFTSKLISSNINNFSHQWIWEKEQGANPLLANIVPMKNFEDVIVFSNKHDTAGVNPIRKYSLQLRAFTNYSRLKFRKVLGNYSFQHFMEGNKESSQFSLCTEETYDKLISKFNIDKMEGFKTYEELKVINKNFKEKCRRTYNPQMTKGTPYTSGKGTTGDITNNVEKIQTINEGVRYPTSIIKFNTDKRNSLHPTQKPIKLMEYLIKTYTDEGDLVVDFTMGSGTTGVACQNTNRRFIGVELDKEYFNIAKERLNII